MGKSSRSKGSSIIGKGEVTPTQIAFIVDRYLYDNRFSETRNLFRSEASSLISNSPIRQVCIHIFCLINWTKSFGFWFFFLTFLFLFLGIHSQVPYSLMTLDAMLNHYVSLKEQKVSLDQEKVKLDQEKIRVQNLLQGMQNVMNSYNASLTAPPPPPPPPPASAPTSQQKNHSVSSSGLEILFF